ncbi:MAG: hypothetical protein A3B38_04355 [Candidatus Levybacteria bacterium RIFCSPLOWO2_01_FULL_36_13]|nr:MAG: hypothetical protein A2684_00100 [Candidatus Levybacteria bacterium RIFCSPHIGHO2_01_FULL_36_15b]OGH34061.1 MAG: hypothetical protein A3B38_04355 [Candidatus Levybacteria bacterium RIFCSPLOWO2_01_FULL_36_13]
MTVEVERTIKRTERHGFLGLKKREVEETTRRIAEYRTVTQKTGLGGSVEIGLTKRESLTLTGLRELYGKSRVADVISPDKLRVVDWTSYPFELKPPKIDEQTFSENEINEANLVSEDGKRLVWRKTRPGDYPEIMPLPKYGGELVVKQP